MYEWQNTDKDTAVETVTDRSPLQFKLGYYMTNALSELLTGRFCWFGSPDELLDFMLNVEAEMFFCPVDEKEKYLVLKKTIERILDRDDSAGALTEPLQTQIYEVLTIAEVSWWGKFSDLCLAKDLFSKDLINGFYESVYDEYFEDDAPHPVEKKDIPKFVKYLKEYGQIEFE